MSTDDRRRVHDSSDDHVRRRDDVTAFTFRQRRATDGLDVPGCSGFPPLCPPPSGEFVPAPVSVTV